MNNLHAKFVQILMEENEHANCLAKAASIEHMLIPSQGLSFVQISPLIDIVSVQGIGFKNNWMTLLICYLKDDVLLDGKEAARKLKVQVTRFVLTKDILYKRGFSRTYLRCLITKEVDYVMREIHEGVYRNHSGSRSLVHKLIWVGYY